MSSVPDGAIEPEQAVKKITKGGKSEDRKKVRKKADISVEEIHGKKKVVKFLTRTADRSTRKRSFSKVVDTDSVDLRAIVEADEEEVDRILDGVFGEQQSVEEIDEGPPTAFDEADYSGVVTQTKVSCDECNGSGQSCDTCSGSGRVSCSRCSSGTIEHECGCVGKQINYGEKNNKAVAKTGRVLTPCPRCGGDGNSEYGGRGCETCDDEGALIETCTNCGGDGVSRREQCTRCEGSGYLTCSRCDGAGDVDVCSTCEGAGFRVEQEIQSIHYETQTESTIDGHSTICDNADEINWEEVKTQTVDTDFDDLPVDPPSEGDVVRAELTEFESPGAYKADISIKKVKEPIEIYAAGSNIIEKSATAKVVDKDDDEMPFGLMLASVTFVILQVIVYTFIEDSIHSLSPFGEEMTFFVFAGIPGVTGLFLIAFFWPYYPEVELQY